MTEDPPELIALDKGTAVYRRTETAHDKARENAIALVVAALRANHQPTEVARRSPFTAAYVRTIAREHDIPPAAPGIKPKKAPAKE